MKKNITNIIYDPIFFEFAPFEKHGVVHVIGSQNLQPLDFLFNNQAPARGEQKFIKKLDKNNSAVALTSDRHLPLTIRLSGAIADPTINFSVGNDSVSFKATEYLKSSGLFHGNNQSASDMQSSLATFMNRDASLFFKAKLGGFIDANDSFYSLISESMLNALGVKHLYPIAQTVCQLAPSDLGSYDDRLSKPAIDESNEDLREKLKRWLQPHPELATPLQTAAIAYAMKVQLQKETTESRPHHDYKEVKSYVIGHLDSAMQALLWCEHPRDYEAWHLTKFNNGWSDLQGAWMKEKSLYDIMQLFNKITTPNKFNFFEGAKRLSKKYSDCKFVDLIEALNGVAASAKYDPDFIKEVGNHAMHINTMLNAMKHPLVLEDMRKIGSPDDGPKSINELILCCMFHHRLSEIINARDGRKKAEGETNDAVMTFIETLDEIQNDIPYEHRKRIRKSQIAATMSLSQTHQLSIEHLMGLIHYYIGHNKDKMSAHSVAQLERGFLNIVRTAMEEAVDEHPILAREKTPETLIEMLEQVSDLVFVDYPKPNTDEVISSLHQSIDAHFKNKPKRSGKTKAKMEAIRASRPDSLEEVIVLHYTENSDMRKVRGRLFSNEKREFLQGLAQTHTQELLAIGLNEEEINLMAKDGKIPEGSGLTVEHIIDREHGGTNHQQNFILMPSTVNKKKDDLKRAQTSFIKNSEDGCWIIAWAPIKREDGTYPKVFMDELTYEPHAKNTNKAGLASQAYEWFYAPEA